MMILPLMFGLPLLFAAGWLFLLVRGPRRGLVISALMAGVTIATMSWAILQSRASTAGIGFLFAPGMAALSGALALAFGHLRVDARTPLRAAGWLCLIASVGVPVALVVSGRQVQTKNASRDREQEIYRQQLEENRRAIAALVRDNPGREEAALDAEIEKHRDDQAFLVPALETAFVSEDRIDRLADRRDVNLDLTLVRNSRTRPATIARIFRGSSYPPYLFLAVAQNPNTPVEILRQLADHPEPIARNMIESALSRNPSTPPDVLERLGR